MSSGTGAQLAIVRVGSLTKVASTDSSWNFTNFVSEGLEHKLEELEEGSITGRRDAPPSHKGIDYGEGEIVIEPSPIPIGHYIRAAFGIASGTVLTQAGSTGANSGNFAGNPVLQHTFTPRQAAHDSSTFLEPYAFMIYRDVGSAFVFNGAVVPSLTFNIQAGQLVGATANVMARQVDRMERTATISSLVSSAGQPMVWDAVSVELGPGANSLAAVTNYESLEIAIETPIEGVVFLDGTKKYGEFQTNDFRRVNISGTMSFRDHEAYDDFIAYAPQYFKATITSVNSNYMLGNPNSVYYPQLQFVIPQMKYLSWNPPVGGPNRLQATFTAKGEYSESDGYMIKAYLTNIHSSYNT